MKIATSELEHLREEVKNCHRIIEDLQKKRKFVGLTDEDWDEIFGNALTIGEAIKVTEVKLKQKNGYAEEKNT